MTRAVIDASVGSLSALVVDPALDELLHLVSMLSGFRVTATDSFAEAKACLVAQPPSILVTALQLGNYNGLHLVLRGKSSRPEMAAVIISPIADPVLHADSEAMGATFMLKPFAGAELRAATLRTLARLDALAPPIRPPFERRSRERRESVVAYSAERRESERRQPLPWDLRPSAPVV